jgi:hypothetical protein
MFNIKKHSFLVLEQLNESVVDNIQDMHCAQNEVEFRSLKTKILKNWRKNELMDIDRTYDHDLYLIFKRTIEKLNYESNSIKRSNSQLMIILIFEVNITVELKFYIKTL